MKNKSNLKDGFTTGTAATAATMAAFNLLLNNIKSYEVLAPLPPFFYESTNCLENCLELNPYDNHFFQSHDYNTICTKGMMAKKSLKIPILRIESCSPHVAQAEVEKDGGDDPDATKHAHIIATVTLIQNMPIQNSNPNSLKNESHYIENKDNKCVLINNFNIAHNSSNEHDLSNNHSLNNKHDLSDTSDLSHDPNLNATHEVNANSNLSYEYNSVVIPKFNTTHALYVNIDAEDGIGRVTMPGLAVPVGFAAINPVPRLQIACGLHQIAAQHNFSGNIEVRLSVPHGKKIARHTLNARLGIIGGISILGTQGIVKPYSHAAWKDTILKCLDIASIKNNEQICFCTGRRSERLIMQKYPLLPAQSFIQSADFVGLSLEEAHKRKFKKIVWACFFGKFVKLAEGHFYTHARSSELNMDFIVKYCEKYEASCTKEIASCVTAAHALELLLKDAVGMHIIHAIAQKAAHNAQNFAKQRVYISLFHIQGYEILSI